MRVFPCEVNLASSMIALVSEDKISSGDLPARHYISAYQAKFRLRANSPDRSLAKFGRRDQDWTARRARSAQPAGRPPSTRQRVKNDCNPHLGP